MLKTVVYKTSGGKYFSIIIRWDLDVNEIKVRKFIQKKYKEWFTQATEEDLEQLWTIRGFVTPLKNSGLKMDNYADYSLLTVKNFFWGANASAKSTKNINISDLDILEYGDFNEPKEWFTSNNVKWEKLTFRKASEVWNIFYLWDKYSKPFWLSFSDENNKTIDKVEMWCYWIWVSRLMWVMAEYFMTENWIAWPENIAPYDYYIIVIWKENIPKWEELALILEKEWKSVILDDRLENIGFWQKAWDCELYWIPNRIVISQKTIEQGGYELLRRGEEARIVKF
jgi:prolyl-tRNA synthetase